MNTSHASLSSTAVSTDGSSPSAFGFFRRLFTAAPAPVQAEQKPAVTRPIIRVPRPAQAHREAAPEISEKVRPQAEVEKERPIEKPRVTKEAPDGYLVSKAEIQTPTAAEVELDALLRELAAIGSEEAGVADAPSHPLHLAALLGEESVLDLLLKSGGDVNAKNGSDDTPLHVAVSAGQKAAVEFLLAAGADLHAKGFNGETALFRATRADLAELLVAKGASLSAVSSFGQTPLHYAAFGGKLDLVKVFLAKGAQADARVIFTGTQPLHLAAQSGHKDVVELLLANGAKLEATNDLGQTARQIAAANGHEELAKMLETKAAPVISENHSGVEEQARLVA